MRLVILESPYAADTDLEQVRNIAYARACMRKCLQRGDAPFASHLLYTQPRVLDDDIPEERELGINAGLKWGVKADVTVVFGNYGITEGMLKGIEAAKACGRPVEYDKLTPEELEGTEAKLFCASGSAVKPPSGSAVKPPQIDPPFSFRKVLDGRLGAVRDALGAVYDVLERLVAEDYDRGLDHSLVFDELRRCMEILDETMRGKR